VQTEREPSRAEQVFQLVMELAPNPPAREPPLDAQLEDLGYDSLACADLAVAVEERFGVRLSAIDSSMLRTVGDVVASLERPAADGPRLAPGIGRSVGVSKAIAGPVLRWWYHMRIEGSEHVPATGPVIVAANHRSMLDIPVLVIACPRRIVFMAKIELYRNAVLRRLWFELGGFPVRRSIADLRATDMSLAVLEQHGALGLFPEGTRSFTGEMLPFLQGAAWMALATGAPIVPCGISGTLKGKRTRGDQPRARLRRQVTVAFGPPVRTDPEADPAIRREKALQVTHKLLEDVTGLLVRYP
jgi:1-acyl-sn-glycerol-3-phosphate acyltransferase